jgi:hypothetical protein
LKGLLTLHKPEETLYLNIPVPPPNPLLQDFEQPNVHLGGDAILVFFSLRGQRMTKLFAEGNLLIVIANVISFIW